MDDLTQKINLKSASSEQNDLLNYAIDKGIINLDSVQSDYMASRKELIQKNHRYAITPPSDSNQRWQTYYKGRDGKRKLLRAQTKEELIDKLIPIYFTDVLSTKLTLGKLFEEWLSYRKELSNSPNTPMRHKQRYEKYIKPTSLHDTKLSHITEIMLEKECNGIVKRHNLSSKEWVNVKTILNGMFKYAMRMGYLSDNPIERIEISVKFRQIVKKTGKTQTYNTEELHDLYEYLEKMYAETKDDAFLAVKLNFLMGLRVGELVALKWEDICEDNHIHIVREEVRNQATGELEVVDHTKTHTDRLVILVPKAMDILARIKKQGEYIFMRDGERITARQINYVLEKYAERTGQKTKSSHKMRKTYASMLNANGVPIDAIREQLGHSNLSTTYGYIYNPLTEKETYNLIAAAL